MKGRRRLRALCAAVVLAVSAGAVATQTAGAAQPRTGPGQVQVDNASLKLVRCYPNCGGNWKEYFLRVATKPHLPDVMALLEVPFQWRGRMVRRLAAATGTATTAWAKVHTDAGLTCDPVNECGNAMIVFRKAKFALVGEPLRLPRHTGSYNRETGVCTLTPTPKERDIAVQLQEKDASGNPVPGNRIVAASIHPTFKLPGKCVGPLLTKLDENLEQEWPDRPLTVVMGDFNQAAQGTGRSSTAERKELCPDRWYREFSLPQDRSGYPTCSPPLSFSGEYRDSIWEMHHAEPDDICREWTAWNQTQQANPGRCWVDTDNRKNNKQRIDFIWVRREIGAAVTEPTILRAETDRGWHDDANNWPSRYSDHRALDALFQW